MAIATETIVLKVEGKTDGAVRATEKLAQSQKKLQREVSATSQAMSQIPATRTTGLIGNIGNALKTAGIDAKGFSQGLRDIGKGLTFDLIRRGLKGLGTDLDGVAGSALSAGANGAAMGAAFGGPFGAAIGGAAGALIGLIRHTDRQSEASKRAAKAAREHAAALREIADSSPDVITGADAVRKQIEIQEARIRNLQQEILGGGTGSRSARGALLPEFEKLNELQQEYARITLDVVAIERARRSSAELDEMRLRNLNELVDLRVISFEEYEKQLLKLQGIEETQAEGHRITTEAIKKQTAAIKEQVEVRRALFGGAAFLSPDEIARNTTDVFSGPRSVASPIGAPQMDGLDVPGAAEAAAEAARQALVANNQALIARQEMADAIQREIDLQREYTSLVSEAYGAIVDGSGGAVEALKNVAKQHLLALGMREAVEAASQFAYGLGALANPLFAGAAAMHFASAAKHAGAAALAGVGVAAIGAIGGGGGASSASSAASAGGGYGGGSSGQPTQTVTNYIITGSDWAEESPRLQQRKAKRLVSLADNKTSAGGGF